MIEIVFFIICPLNLNVSKILQLIENTCLLIATCLFLPLKTWSFGPPARRAYASESQARDRWLCLGVLCLKSQIPSTKLQINLKLQITNSKPVQRAAQVLAPHERLFFLFGILNFGHAQRRRLRRVLLFACPVK